jgi:hypothetical protein
MAMAKKWTHTACFQSFGTEPKNVQWSWSARSPDGKTVVVTLWQDLFVRKDGHLTYSRPETDRKDLGARPGFGELMENLVWAREKCNGRLHVIIAIARDRNADPRSIAECFPSPMVMKLTHLDVGTGAYVAEADGD